MSKELPQDFKCLVLFAALSGREFVKSELDIKMKVSDIERLNEDHGLLAIARKGQTRTLKSNSETISWVATNLNTELEGKNKAVRAVLDLVRARAAAYLDVKRISMLDFLRPDNTCDAVRRAYLELSGGAYKARILLKDLRKLLSVDRTEQDEALNELMRTGEADLYPEDDPGSRDEDDDRAALQVADRYRHVIYLNPEK